MKSNRSPPVSTKPSTKQRNKALPDLEVSGRDEIADWIETCLLVRNDNHLGLNTLNEMARELIDTSEHQVALAVRSMERRSDLLADSYPFRITDDYLQVDTGAQEFPYTSLLTMTATSPFNQLVDLSHAEFEASAIQFEKITEEAIRSLLGPGSKALRFGYPNELGRPSGFQEAMVWLAEQLEVKLGDSYRPPKRKDGGVDVIGWKPFPDNKSGMPVLLVQCTLQRDFTDKAADIELRHWSGWIKLQTPPTAVLAIPGHVDGHEKWEEISARSMILDRCRLAGLLDTTNANETIEELHETTLNRIERVAEAMSETHW